MVDLDDVIGSSVMIERMLWAIWEGLGGDYAADSDSTLKASSRKMDFLAGCPR
jgi:hypothetical protein